MERRARPNEEIINRVIHRTTLLHKILVFTDSLHGDVARDLYSEGTWLESHSRKPLLWTR